MAKLLFTNNENVCQLLRKTFREVGFEESFSYDGLRNDFFTAYRKLAIKNSNCYVEYTNGGKDTPAFICAGIGTLFFDGKLAETSVLKKICDAYKNGSTVAEIKKRCLGCYCAFIYDVINNNVVVFVDDYNLFNAYYSIDNKGNYVITNTYWHIATILKKPIDLLKTCEYAHTLTILDNGTPYKDIYRLADDEYIYIYNNEFLIKKIDLIERNDTYFQYTYNEICNNLIEKIKQNCNIVKNNFQEASLCMTGGIDSRITLAALYNAGLSPRLVYWIGNSIMTGTEDSDKYIVELISSKLKLEAAYVNAPTDRFPSNSNVLKKYLLKYGELYQMYGCNQGIFKMFENRKIVSSFHDYGVGSNFIKACELAALPSFEKGFGGNNTLTIKDVVEKIYLRSGAREAYPQYEKIVDLVQNELKVIIDKEAMNQESLTRKNVSLFSLAWFKRANSINYVLTNNYVYSFPVAVTKEMYRIIADTNYAYRAKNHMVVDLFLKLTEQTPILRNIPFYSDIRKMIITKDKTMREPKKNIYIKKIANMKRLLIKGIMYEKLRKLYHNLTNKKQGDEADAIDYWLSPMEEYLSHSAIWNSFNIQKPLENLHSDQFLYLFFVIWAKEHSNLIEEITA